MAAPAHTSKSPLKVAVSEDRQQAWVELAGLDASSRAALTAEDVLAAAKRARIAITETVSERAAALVDAVTRATQDGAGTGASEVLERFLIAEGQAPIEAEDGRIEWSPELAAAKQQPAEDDEQVNYFATREIVTVPAGAQIGRILPSRDGTDGIDVHGSRRPPRRGTGTRLRPGIGVALAAPDSDVLVATTAGRVTIEGEQVRIVEVLDLRGDVDFESGSIDACVDVHVGGTIRSRFNVRTTGTLSVGRVIEAAEVDVGGDLVVRGGIFGQERTGRVRAGGRVTAKLLNEVDLATRGDLEFLREVLNSRVSVQGRLSGPRGTIIGGEVYAREGIEVRVIGSEGCVTTCVAVGIHVNTLRRVRRIERQIKELVKSAEQIRSIVSPLLANAKRLLPAQRERATELLCKADEIELQIEDLRQQAQQTQQQGAPLGTPCILVAEAVYPGVRITFNARETRVQGLMHGPVKVELRRVNNVTELAAVNQRTGSVTVLPSSEVDLDVPPTDEAAPNAKKEQTDERVVGHHPT